MANSYAVVDLECAPDPARMDLPAPEHWLKAPANYKKPETIAAYREDQLRKWPDHLKEQGSVDPFLGRIVAIGATFQADLPLTDFVGTVHNNDERSLLHVFWTMAASCEHLIGFGLRDFDWDWLLMRSAYHGLTIPRWWDPSPYTRHGLIDLQVLLNQGRAPKAGRSLAAVAEYFALEERPIGDGADVPKWVEEGRWDLVTEHCASDVRTTRALLEKIGPTYLGWPVAE